MVFRGVCCLMRFATSVIFGCASLIPFNLELPFQTHLSDDQMPSIHPWPSCHQSLRVPSRPSTSCAPSFRPSPVGLLLIARLQARRHVYTEVSTS